MNNLYELGLTVFRATTRESQNFQNKILKEEIVKKLANKDDSYIQQAVSEAYSDNKDVVAHHIEEQTYHLINTITQINHLHTLRSDLFVLPVVIHNEKKETVLPALSSMEKTIKTLLVRNSLLESHADVVLAPMLLGYNTSLTMTPTKWYDLHIQLLTKADKRHLRKVFAYNFSINVEPNYPTVSFIIGSIIQHGQLYQNSQPAFLKHDFNLEKQQQNFNKQFQDFFDTTFENINYKNVESQNKKEKKEEKKRVVTLLRPQHILDSLEAGYSYYQELLTQIFINSYNKFDNVEFALISLDKPNHLALFAWHKNANKIDNYLLVEPFNSDVQENIDMIMNFVAPTKKNMYIGNTFIDSQILQNYKNFDFKNYMDKEGATVLESEEIYD